MGLPVPLPYEEDQLLCSTAREYTVPARGSRKSLVKVWLNCRQSAEGVAELLMACQRGKPHS